jgi:hypothetical protein
MQTDADVSEKRGTTHEFTEKQNCIDIKNFFVIFFYILPISDAILKI